MRSLAPAAGSPTVAVSRWPGGRDNGAWKSCRVPPAPPNQVHWPGQRSPGQRSFSDRVPGTPIHPATHARHAKASRQSTQDRDTAATQELRHRPARPQPRGRGSQAEVEADPTAAWVLQRPLPAPGSLLEPEAADRLMLPPRRRALGSTGGVPTRPSRSRSRSTSRSRCRSTSQSRGLVLLSRPLSRAFWDTGRASVVRADRRFGQRRGSSAPSPIQLVSAAIWMRLPHVSSNTAVVTGPMSAGGCVKRTP